MHTITARNVNFAYQEGLWLMQSLGVPVESRNGAVLRVPGPVATVYLYPTERMLLDEHRDANPFFHIFESVWMLAGRNDVEWISQFNSNMKTFSDDGTTFHGAYGWRWRNQWDHDQLLWVINHLITDPNSRRAVIQMFDPEDDQRYSRDIPCNTGVYFEIFSGALNMAVTCRSNDMIWGAYGANAVHMSVLQEFVANALGVPVGQYVQFSNNFHMYERHFGLLDWRHSDPIYPGKEIINSHIPIVRTDRWKNDFAELIAWVDYPETPKSNPFIRNVLTPMLLSWTEYKNKNKMGALEWAESIRDLEVANACYAWLTRRNWDVAEVAS